VERTLIIIKPDAVQRALIGEIVRRFEARGLRIVGMKLLQAPRGLAEKHYAEHAGRRFYEGLLDYITSAPVVVMALEAPNAIKIARDMIGATKPIESPPGSIRGDFGIDVGRNLIHGSDGPESAERELALWFAPGELVEWRRSTDPWIFEEA